jgi:hypothetical protein
MIDELNKLSFEQWFAILGFALSVLVSFLFGYMVFRYTQLEICKPGIEVLEGMLW